MPSSTSMRIGTRPVAAKLATWMVRVLLNSSVQISWSPANTRNTELVANESIRGYGTTRAVPIVPGPPSVSTTAAPAASPSNPAIRPSARRREYAGADRVGPDGSRPSAPSDRGGADDPDDPTDTAFPPSDPVPSILVRPSPSDGRCKLGLRDRKFGQQLTKLSDCRELRPCVTFVG